MSETVYEKITKSSSAVTQRPHSAYYHSALVPWLPSLAESTEDYDREMDDYTQEDAERLRLPRAVYSYHYSPTLTLPMMEHSPTDS
ncbi:hypothetical protein AOLI_G00296900 [Acnodon oligacanthus]